MCCNPSRQGMVSIHASAREATESTGVQTTHCKVSIHASAREATIRPIDPFEVRGFQSTPPRGRRHRTFIAIANRGCFNPRLREGGDLQPPGIFRCLRSFNPRLREGGDPPSISWTMNFAFQSTPPRGRRLF